MPGWWSTHVNQAAYLPRRSTRNLSSGTAPNRRTVKVRVPATRAETEPEGEIAGISYRIQGAGPPLVLLPLELSPGQWGPLVPALAAQWTTITLGGPHLGRGGGAPPPRMAARSRLEPNRQLVGISSLRIPALRFGDRPPRPFPPAPEVRFAHDSALEGAVSSEPVSGVRFPGYWEKIQGISAESQQERF